MIQKNQRGKRIPGSNSLPGHAETMLMFFEIQDPLFFSIHTGIPFDYTETGSTSLKISPLECLE